MLRINSNRPSYGDTALKGLTGGLGLGVLNVIVYLFFVFPIVAHDLFHTYMHYDSSTLGYAAAYVGTLGLLGIPTALVIARALTRREPDETDVRQSPAAKVISAFHQSCRLPVDGCFSLTLRQRLSV